MDKKDILIIVGVLSLIFFDDIKSAFSKLKGFESKPSKNNSTFNALYSESGQKLMMSEPFKEFAQTPEFDILLSPLSDSQVNDITEII